MYEANRSTGNRTRQGTINLRVSNSQRDLIDRAARALGRNRSDFMLEAASREAEKILLDQRYFTLSNDAFRRFTALLDRPATKNEKLHRLLHSRAPWEK